MLLEPTSKSETNLRTLSTYAIQAGFDFVQRRGSQIYVSVRAGSCTTAIDLLFVLDESGSMMYAV